MLLVIRTIYIIIIPAQVINPISSPITAKIKSVVFGYKNPKCVCVPFIQPCPTSLPAPIASFDCIMLYPAPLGSKYGFKYTSILSFACSGSTKKYNSGNEIIKIKSVSIIYLLFMPAT